MKAGQLSQSGALMENVKRPPTNGGKLVGVNFFLILRSIITLHIIYYVFIMGVLNQG